VERVGLHAADERLPDRHLGELADARQRDGKDTLATGLAKAMDRSEEGFDAKEKSTLSAEKFGDEVIPSVEDQSAVVMDETQGTPGEGSGMNRMRAMAQSTMDAINSVMANRDKNLTIILVVQQIGMLFSDIYPMIDAWLLINKAPGQIGGPECKHHTFYTEDYPDGDGGLKTPIVEIWTGRTCRRTTPITSFSRRRSRLRRRRGRRRRRRW